MSFIHTTGYNKHDRKFLEECAKIRGINGAVVVSSGEYWECDYDELKDVRRKMK